MSFQAIKYYPTFYYFFDGKDIIIEIFKYKDLVRCINTNNEEVKNEKANFLKSMNLNDRLEYIRNLICSKNIINKFSL